jgi:putrescine transport system substrate-binding protein
MRKSLLIVGFVLLAACGSDRPDGGGQEAQSEDRVLNVFNWADYIGKSTIADFEAKTGIKVNYDVYDSSEVMETKLLTGGSGYDVVVPSGARGASLIRIGAFRKLDKSKLKNLSNLDPTYMGTLAGYDPGNEYALPYLWGTTGIGYNPDMVEKVLGTRVIDSLSAVFDPAIASKLAKCGITIVDAPESMFMLAFIYLGVDANSERPENLVAAEALMARARPYIRYFHSSQYVNDLASGEICVSIGWSNAIMQARMRGAQSESPVEVIYTIPREGGTLYFDMMAIPIDAPHPENAYAFLDYVAEPEVIADITNSVRAANGNRASLPFVAEDLRGDSGVYPAETVFKRLWLEQPWTSEKTREVTRAWTRIRTGQ